MDRNQPFRRHNLEVAFPDEVSARDAIATIESAEPDIDITTTEADRIAVLRGEMRDEIDSTVMGPGPVGPFTKGQSRGIVKWAPIGAATGALIMVAIAALVWPTALGFIWLGIIGAAAGATLGFTAGGAFNPKYHDDAGLANEAGTTIGLHSDDEKALARAASLLEKSAAAGAFRVGPTGDPRRPSSEDAQRPVRGE